MTLEFVVYGVAAPKGSAKAFMPKGARFPIVTHDSPKTKPWQQLVADRASAALEPSGGAMFDGALALSVTFYLPRPKSLPKRVTEHVTRPDLDKLVRAVKDALTKVAWQDDGQVVHVNATKRFAAVGAAPHAQIRITHWTDEQLTLAPTA